MKRQERVSLVDTLNNLSISNNHVYLIFNDQTMTKFFNSYFTRSSFCSRIISKVLQTLLNTLNGSQSKSFEIALGCSLFTVPLWIKEAINLIPKMRSTVMIKQSSASALNRLLDCLDDERATLLLLKVLSLNLLCFTL